MSIRLNGKLKGRERRKVRVRKRIHGTEARPRLNVFRSTKHIYAQVIDDISGRTLAQAGTSGKVDLGAGDKSHKAKAIGQRIAEACREQGIEAVVFDRNGYRYHGRVRAVAEAARLAGLKF